MTSKCTCGRRTPFAHNHAETCPCFQPQLIGRCYRITPAVQVLTTAAKEFVVSEATRMLADPADYASDFAEAFQLIFEGYNRPADNFGNDTAWATWQHGQLRKAFQIMQRLRSKQSDPADELGKVLDVLRAAGINSVSASEGVKLLAVKAKWAVPPFPSSPNLYPNPPKPMCDHDWMHVESLSRMCCSKCEATRSST